MREQKGDEEEVDDDDDYLWPEVEAQAAWIGFYPWPLCRAGFWLR